MGNYLFGSAGHWLLQERSNPFRGLGFFLWRGQSPQCCIIAVGSSAPGSQSNPPVPLFTMKKEELTAVLYLLCSTRISSCRNIGSHHWPKILGASSTVEVINGYHTYDLPLKRNVKFVYVHGKNNLLPWESRERQIKKEGKRKAEGYLDWVWGKLTNNMF